jgi:hypothetical protein
VDLRDADILVVIDTDCDVTRLALLPGDQLRRLGYLLPAAAAGYRHYRAPGQVWTGGQA